MGKQQDYVNKVYSVLSQPETGFKLSEAQFREKIQDPSYVEKVHRVLSQPETGFRLNIDEFSAKLVEKKSSNGPTASSGMGVLLAGKGKPQETVTEQTVAQIKKQPITNKEEGLRVWDRTKSTLSTLGKSIVDGVAATSLGQIAIVSKTIDDEARELVGLKPLSKPIGEYQTYKWAKEIMAATDKTFAPNPEFKGELQETVAQTAGDLLGLVATAIITKNPTSALAKLGTKGIIKEMANASTRKAITRELAKETVKSLAKPTAFIAAAQTGVRNYDEALAKGATEDEANAMYWSTAATGAIANNLPIGSLLNRFDKASGGKMKDMVIGGVVGGIEEAVTEGIETISTNFAAQNIYDETRKLFEGVGESTAMGGGMGFVLNAMGVKLGSLRNQYKNNPEKLAEVDQSIGYIKDIAEIKGQSEAMKLSKEEQISADRYTKIIDNPNQSEDAKDIAKVKLQELTGSKIIQSEAVTDKISKLSEDDQLEVKLIDSEIDRLKDAASNSSDVDIKDQLEADIKEQESVKQSILDKADMPVSLTIETENEKAIAQALSTPEETAKALESAKVFQPKMIEELTAPKIGDTATLFDKNGEVVENGVQVSNIDVETNMVTITDSNGKEKKVPLARVNKTIEQVAQEFHSGVIAPELLTEIVTKDISDPDVNQQRRMSAPVQSVANKNIIGAAPEWVQNIYKKYISAGDRNTLRALETKESILAEKRDRLASVSKRLSKLIGKDTDARKDANTVLSQDYVDDKIDSFTNKKTDEAIAVLTGTDLETLREAYSNPNTDDNKELLKRVNDNLKAQTKKGTKKEVEDLIYNEVIKDKEVVRDLSVKWMNVGRGDNKSVTERKVARQEIEDKLMELPNGEKVIETLKEAKLNTIQAKRGLLKTKPGRELLSTVNEARDMIDEFSKWVDNNIAALNIRDKDIGQSIINNSGLYVKKTYDYWTDKEFTLDEKLGKQAVDSIKRTLLPQRLSALASTKKFESATEEKRAEMIKDLEDKANKDASEIFTDYIVDITEKKEYKPSSIKVNDAKVQSKNTWEREFISEEFGKILGRSGDAIDRLHASVIAQSQIQSAAEMGMIMEKLSGGDFYNSRQSAIDTLLKSGMSEVEAGVHIGKNYKEVSDKFSPINGKLIPTDIYDMVYENLSASHGALFNWLKAATVLWRLGKTVYNPSGHITNGLGGHIAIAEQGHTVDSQTINFLVDRFKLIGGSGKISPEAKEIKRKMIDTGLWGSSVSIGEINLLLKYANELGSGDKNRSQEALIAIKKGFNEKFGGIKRYYSATDDFSKLILFHKKKDVFSEKLYGKPYESLTSKEEAIVDANIAERVKQNMPTSSRIPKFAKALIGSVVVGDFQGFRFGAFTSFANTLGNALGDINKGLSDKSLSKRQKKAYLLDGSRTLMGSASIFAVDKTIGASVTGLASMALGKMAKGLFDDKEDDDKKPIGSRFDMYQNIKNSFYMPDWGKGQNVIVVSDDGKGNLQLMNLSNTFPNDEAYQLFGAQENLPLINMDGASGFSSVYSKTITLNAVLNIFNNANRGYDNWNRPIDDGVLAKTLYVASEFSIPSIRHLHKEAVAFAKDQQGAAPEDYSEQDTRKVTAYNYIKGILKKSPQLIKRTYPLNMNQQLFYNFRAFYDKNDTKFDRLSDGEKQDRIKELEPVRKAFLLMKNYNVHQKESKDASAVFEDIFTGLRGKVSEEEQNYILTGEKPFKD